MAFPLRQYLRAILVPFGLADRKAYELVLNAVYPDDTYIVSYPKSGNTWMRFIVSYLKSGEEQITFRTLDQYVPDIYSHKEQANAVSRPRFLKSHQSCYPHYPKCIYVVRDYRDVLVSYYQYHKALGDFNGTIEDYASEINSLHPFGSWKAHVSEALKFRNQFPDRMLIVRYEDLLANPIREVQLVAKFCQLPECNVDMAVKKCLFEKLQAEENRSGSQFKDLSNANFFRSGKAGSWQTEISESLLQQIETEHLELFTQLGYK